MRKKFDQWACILHLLSHHITGVSNPNKSKEEQNTKWEARAWSILLSCDGLLSINKSTLNLLLCASSNKALNLNYRVFLAFSVQGTQFHLPLPCHLFLHTLFAFVIVCNLHAKFLIILIAFSFSFLFLFGCNSF